MYLSKLELFGFKSFASRTGIKFTKGITGIVGPNGCGKTNIVDALRWSLGEQKSSTLRSDKMENVIFNGTRSRKPMGMSEVSLTLVNDDNTLPTEYSEVKITRRIFRSGESEYLLNNNICRLKDITNLFMDTGMGTNAYSVIELKMIEVILSNKQEERRRMFEEAAGVNKYKLRRRHSLKKLEDVKSDLTRVNDIVSEVEKNVRSLERQAKKADRYNQVQSVLREKELDLAERNFFRFSTDKERLTGTKEEKNTRKLEIDSNIKSIENELIQFRARINEVDSKLRNKRSEINAQSDKIHDLKMIISVADERLNSLEKNLERFTGELEELHFQKEENEEIISENSSKVSALDISINEKEIALSSDGQSIDKLREDFETKKQQLKIKNDEALAKFKDITSKENQLFNLKETNGKLNESIKNLNEKIQRVTNNIAKTVGYLEDLENEKKSTQQKLEASEHHYVEQQKLKESLEKTLTGLREKEMEERGLLKALKDKIEFFQTLIQNLEGVSKGSKVLIENVEWSQKEKTLFADVGNTDEEYRFALEASLKSVLNNLLIEDITTLQKAIDYLKNNDLGKASFFLLNSSNGKKSFVEKLQEFSVNRKRKKIQKEDSFHAWALDLVKSDSKWLPYFSKVLSKTVITKDLNSALSLYNDYPEFNFATLNGDFVQSSGVIEAGSSPKLDETLFGRKQMLENLKNEYPVYESNLVKLKGEIENTEEKITAINLTILSEQGKILTNEINNIDKQISQMEFEKNRSSEEIEKSQEEIQKFAEESNQIENKVESISTELEAVKSERDRFENELTELENSASEVEKLLNDKLSDYNTKKLELERNKGELQNIKNLIGRAEQTSQTIDVTIDKRKSDIGNTGSEISIIKEQQSENTLTLDDLNFTKNKLLEEASEIESRLRSIKDESSELESRLNLLRNERQEISDSIHEIDLKISELKMKLENLVEHIQEEYNQSIELKEFDDLENFDFQAVSREVHEYKEKLKNLGPINLLAYSEYEEEKERLDFLLNQRNDLIESEKDLIKTIHQINDTAQKLFQETFENIRENFKQIFRTLFDPGDEADLILQEDVDPLEAKIEIIAKPKGKRPTSIELLSGGEKTLTATALLFAIYLVKPSPFCVLDEVDAPLDDANIDRFTRLLKEFSKNTQFIIVTHNKRTMEAAENMYGVTMQEEGVSKLVGVQFNEELDAVTNG